MSNPTILAAAETARQLGHDAGIAAASWVFDGNTSTDTYRRILNGLDDGDPEVFDMLPYCDLSGQWADCTTVRDICDACGVDYDTTETWDVDELADTYVMAFDDAMVAEVERVARYQLEEGDES